MSTMGQAASTADDLGSVHPDVAPGAEPLVDSSPGTAAAAAAAACWCGGCVGSSSRRDWGPAEAFVVGGGSESK